MESHDGVGNDLTKSTTMFESAKSTSANLAPWAKQTDIDADKKAA